MDRIDLMLFFPQQLLSCTQRLFLHWNRINACQEVCALVFITQFPSPTWCLAVRSDRIKQCWFGFQRGFWVSAFLSVLICFSFLVLECHHSVVSEIYFFDWTCASTGFRTRLGMLLCLSNFVRNHSQTLQCSAFYWRVYQRISFIVDYWRIQNI